MTKKSMFATLTPLLAVSLLALTACAGPADGSDESLIDNGPGQAAEESPGEAMPIEGIEGTWIFADGTDPSGDLTLDDAVTVTLTITGDSVAGESTCNNYSATLSGDADELVVGPVISTKRACANAALTDFETRYLAAVGSATTAIPTGGSLVMQGDGVTLNFLPSPSLPEG